MASPQYLALLRGINVGRASVTKMADLMAGLEAAGFADVATYIQSGNVLLTTADSALRLTERLERLLSAANRDAGAMAPWVQVAPIGLLLAHGTGHPDPRRPR